MKSRTLTWASCCLAAILCGWFYDRTADQVMDAVFFSGSGLFLHWLMCRWSVK